MEPDRLREIFNYDENIGVLRWKTRGRGIQHGRAAGCINKYCEGRRMVGVDGKIYRHSRLVWMWHHGVLSDDIEIDHKDRNPANDRIENLRLANRQQNTRNRKYRDRGLPRGVHRHGKKYKVRYWTGDRNEYLGLYHTVEEAEAVWKARAIQEHAEFYLEQ